VIEYVQVKDFDRFQHYKDRDPPWIKLYVRILEDYAFAVLPDVHKAHLVLLWVLASKMDNKIPKDPKFVSDKLCAKTPVDLDALLASGFLQPWEEKSSRGKREDWPSRYVSAQTRADLLSHAEFKCAACGATEALEIDHITPISKGGTGEPGNLQVLCRKCNRKKRVKLGKKSAEHLRSDPLRRETDVRSPETETETEGEAKTETETTADAVPESTPRAASHNLGSVIALVVEHLYFGNRPAEAAIRNEASIAKALAKTYGYDRLAQAILGLAKRREAGELPNVGRRQVMSLRWLNSDKFDLNQVAVSEDAVYRSESSPRTGRGATAMADILGNIGRSA
jgi:hypothetical protein